MKIKKIIATAMSSEYGDGKVLGQPNSKKSIVILKIYSDVLVLIETVSVLNWILFACRGFSNRKK